MADTGDDRHRSAVPGARGARTRTVVVVLTGTVLAALAAFTVATAWWGHGLRTDDRLLPGVQIAGVDVGGATVTEARQLAGPVVDERLEAPVTVEHEGRRWTVVPVDLGASSDLDDVLEVARSATTDAGLGALSRARWTEPTVTAHAVGVAVPAEQVAAFVDTIADELELPPTDATLSWVEGMPARTAAVEGLAVDRDATTRDLTAVLVGDRHGPVVVTSEVLPPTVTTAMARSAEQAALAAIDAALDRSVSVRHEDRRWEIRPRELGARVVGEPVVAAALASTVATRASIDGQAETDLVVDVELSVDEVEAFAAELATELDVSPVHAAVSYSNGAVQVSESRDGRALDRTAARDGLIRAVREGDPELVLEVGPVQARTASAFHQVLVVHQGRRTVELHRGGQAVRSWPVAVGTGGSPTPTGTFTIGAKRFEPTWVNPAPDRWGRDMPARIGPGPDNPLGLRALNWNRPGGGDTLIRFHGTPNEASIGSAASNGCVRMFNADVIELYDLVDTGTTILSLA